MFASVLNELREKGTILRWPPNHLNEKPFKREYFRFSKKQMNHLSEKPFKREDTVERSQSTQLNSTLSARDNTYLTDSDIISDYPDSEAVRVAGHYPR